MNADELARELDIGAYEAAEIADALRRALLARRESFIFETVFSDPVGAKVEFLEKVAAVGYEVVLIFIRVASWEESPQRVSMRVAQGGHDVPDEKLRSRFAQTEKNLERAIERLPRVIVFDNSDLAEPYRLEAVYEAGTRGVAPTLLSAVAFGWSFGRMPAPRYLLRLSLSPAKAFALAWLFSPRRSSGKV